MRIILLGAIVLSNVFAVSAQGVVSSRVVRYADDLVRATSRLAERSAEDLLQSRNNAARDVHDTLLAQQIHAGATLLADMVQSRRPASEVREVAVALAELSERGPGYSRSASLWRNVRNAVADVNRELGNRGTPVIVPEPPVERPIVGRVAWSGWVDDRVHLVIRGRSLETRTVSGAARAPGAATFTSPLPDNQVEVGVEKARGRGTVTVVQQPSPVNDYTAVVEIYDGNGGAQEYRLDIFWR